MAFHTYTVQKDTLTGHQYNIHKHLYQSENATILDVISEHQSFRHVVLQQQIDTPLQYAQPYNRLAYEDFEKLSRHMRQE